MSDEAIVLDALTKAVRRAHRRRSCQFFGRSPAASSGFSVPTAAARRRRSKCSAGWFIQRPATRTSRASTSRRQSNRVRRSIGYMAQGFSMYGDLTVDENLEFYARAYGLSGGTARAAQKRAVVEIVGIGEYRELSRGEPLRRMAAAPRACLRAASTIRRSSFSTSRPPGIDPVARRDLWDLLFQLDIGRQDVFRDHALHGRSRALFVARLHLRRPCAWQADRPMRSASLPDVTPPGTVRYAIATDDVMETFRRVHDVPKRARRDDLRARHSRRRRSRRDRGAARASRWASIHRASRTDSPVARRRVRRAHPQDRCAA